MRIPRRRRAHRVGLGALALLAVAGGDPPAPAAPAAPIVISAVFADGYAPGDGDEAVQLWNVSAAPVDLRGWSLDDAAAGASFPEAAILDAGARWWIARDAAAFARSFGHPADWAWAGTMPAAGTRRLATLRGGPTLANAGDTVTLRDGAGAAVDAAVYGRPADGAGWAGPPVLPYHPPGIAAAHQVLYRKLAGEPPRPAGDTDRATDWASDPADVRWGRRIRFPGWDVEAVGAPARAREDAAIEVAVAPDALFGFLARHLSAARESVDAMTYTFEHPALCEALAGRARAGVRVRLMVEGRPAGGIDMRQRWCLALLDAAGAAAYWLDAGGDVGPRYRGAHAKLFVVDGRTVLVGSENPGTGAAPDDDRSDGTLGRRGVYVATDAPSVVAWARALVARDLDPDLHVDVRPFQPRDPERGAPAPDYGPDRASGGAGYRPVAPAPLRARGPLAFEWVTAPENAVHPTAGLLGLLARAGGGDEVLVQQLDEPVWWGDGPAEGDAALNPRLQAYVAAARRGARVRLLLDGFFDDPVHWNSNAATVAFVEDLGRREGLDLQARRGNPAGLGLHNKMVLVRLSGATGNAVHWSHIGSLNGSESASKANREVALQVESEAVHGYLARVFAWDWAGSGANASWLPWVGARTAPP